MVACNVDLSCGSRVLGRALLLLTAAVVATAAWTSSSLMAQTTNPGATAASAPQWIWSAAQDASEPPTVCYFRQRFMYGARDEACQLEIAADDEFAVYVNGRMAGRGEGWRDWRALNLTRFVRQGENTLAIEVRNVSGVSAGLAARLTVRQPSGNKLLLVSDARWRTSLNPSPSWNQPRFADQTWGGAREIGPFGSAPPGPADSATAVVSTSGTKPLTVSRKTDARFRLPREFRLEHLADHAAVGSLIGVTFDEQGRMILSREGGPLLICRTDSSGRFDRVSVYCDQMTNCQGLLCLDGAVYAIGSGPQGGGLYRLRDADNDAQIYDVTQLLALSDKLVEHGPHAVTLGPDGFLYILLGNHTELPATIDPSSPYHAPYEGDLVQPRWSDPSGHSDGVKAPGGVVLRTDREASHIELVCGGLRNPYDLVFHQDGELMTHDSDMESDIGTTWYRPTRVLHVVEGGEYGWRSGWAKWPEYYLDGLPAVASTGRGSPAGAVSYEHRAFPARFRGALFLADWSEGRVLVARAKRAGAGYAVEAQPFMEGQPLNVTDLDVGPDGALYIVTGGRGTAGNIYRVSWRGELDEPASSSDRDPVRAILEQPQPQSAWGRRAIATLRQQLGAHWEERIKAVSLSGTRPSSERIRALRLLKSDGTAIARILPGLATDHDVAVRAEVIYQLGSLSGDDEAIDSALVAAIRDSDAWIRRRACEALLRRHATVSLDDLKLLLSSDDRWESFVARRLLEAQSTDTWRDEILTTDNPRIFNQGAVALLTMAPSTEQSIAIVARGRELMSGFISDRDFVDLLRVFQLALHRANLASDDVPELKDQLAQEFPATDPIINRELVRLLAHLQADTITDRYLQYLAEDLPLEDRVHAAMYLARIPNGWTPAQRLELMRHLEIPNDSGNSVPGYLQRVAMQFGQSIDTAQFGEILQRGEDYPAAALAVSLRLAPPLSDLQLGWLTELDKRIAKEQGERFKRLKVAILAVLARDGSDASMAYIREVYQRDPSRRVEAAVGLAQRPAGANWPLLVQSIPLLDGPIAREVMVRLRGVRQAPSDAEAYRQVIISGLRLGEAGAQDAVALLEHWQGHADDESGEIPWDRALRAWQNWFRQTYPDAPPATLMVSDQNNKWDYDDLLKQLTRADGRERASIERGAELFKSARCAECHRSGELGESMGPDLTSLSRRFLTREILDSILYPSKVISDQYAAKTVITKAGQMYTGIVSQSPTELTVLTPDGRKTRVPMAEVDEIVPSTVSAMPEGLLNGLRLDEVIDLFEFLQADGDTRTAARP